MIYCAIICIVTWAISLLSWSLVSGYQTALPADYHEATWLFGYFVVNTACDLMAYQLISMRRVRWMTWPLKAVLLCSMLLHVAGGTAYVLYMDYWPYYSIGLWVMAFAQILCFFMPFIHRHVCSHQRKRRAISGSVGARRVAEPWPDCG